MCIRDSYVLWELGQPLHAYDYDTVADATIVVRRARADERFTTLDGQERVLDPSILVTASARAAALIAQTAGGTIARGVVDAYPRKRKAQHVRLRMSRVKRVLG